MELVSLLVSHIPPYEDTRSRPTTTQKGTLTRIQPCWHHDLGPPVPGTVRIHLYCLQVTSLWYFVIAVQTD